MFEDFVRPIVKDLENYQPGKPVEEVRRQCGLKEIIKLASNENPWGPSPKALKALRKTLPMSHQYPETTCRELRQALSTRLGVSPEMISVSNGASDILMMITQAFINPGDEVVMATPTFPVMRRATRLAGGLPVEVPLIKFTHDLKSMAAAVGPRTKAVLVCNPNNPTGTTVSRAELEAFIGHLPPGVLVILDEVYQDFSASPEIADGLIHIREGRPVISVRSFSKLYGLAGLRIGYAVACAELIQILDKVRLPFAVSRLAQAAAKAALEDERFRRRVVRQTIAGRALLYQSLSAMGFECVPSQTNFLFVSLNMDGQEASEKLLSRGIIIRPMGIWGHSAWCRISVGTAEQNNKLLEVITELFPSRR